MTERLPMVTHMNTATHPTGAQSNRSYTDAEIKILQRLGMAPMDRLGGPAFWAGGDWWPRELGKMRREAARVVADVDAIMPAIEREWGKL